VKCHPISVEQWKSVCNHWHRCLNYEEFRMNKKKFEWSCRKGNRRCKNWAFTVQDKFIAVGLTEYLQLPFSKVKLKEDMSNIILNDHIAQWTRDIERIEGVNGSGRNKLRSYRLFKTTYQVERYCSMHVSSSHRLAFAKFRCGVALIRLETGRYEELQEYQRLCLFGCGVVESEQHVFLSCPLYMYLHERNIMLQKARSVIGDFTRLGEEELFCLLFTHPDMIRVVAKLVWMY